MKKMITLRLNTNNVDEWDMYDDIVMRGIQHTEKWADEYGVVIVTLAEEDYKFWFCEEEEEEEEEA